MSGRLRLESGEPLLHATVRCIVTAYDRFGPNESSANDLVKGL